MPGGCSAACANMTTQWPCWKGMPSDTHPCAWYGPGEERKRPTRVLPTCADASESPTKQLTTDHQSTGLSIDALFRNSTCSVPANTSSFSLPSGGSPATASPSVRRGRRCARSNCLASSRAPRQPNLRWRSPRRTARAAPSAPAAARRAEANILSAGVCNISVKT